jgi:hypothetical protein
MSSNIPSTTLDDVDVTAQAPTAPVAPTTTPYARRIIQLTFLLGTGNFGESGENQLQVSGLRCSVRISNAQVPSASGRAQILVFGLTLNQINTLTQAGLYFRTRRNFVAVQAGDAQSGLATIFNGNIQEAYFTGKQPNVGLAVVANDWGPNGVINLKPVPPTSFPGNVPIGTALRQIVSQAGLTVENNGVNAVLASPYFPGTVWQQVRAAVTAANCFAYLDTTRQILAIWPKDASRAGTPILVSPETGMIDYPEFMANRIRVRVPFNPAFNGSVGKSMVVKSQLTAAGGPTGASWSISQVDTDISSELPGGPWEMAVVGVQL